MIQHPDIHAVVLRKVANTLRKSVFAQYQWAIDKLGLSGKFLATVSPMELTYLPTGQKVLFFGTDDPANLKSIKVPFGYIGILHFEEWDQFAGLEETRNIEQSVLRGGAIALEFKTFNPPKTRDNFANRYILQNKPGQLVHKSTFLQAPPDWLGPRFIADAEHLKETNPAAYEHEYLGVANGSGGQVFDNLDIRAITSAEIREFDRIYNGVDWGYYPDPWAFNQMHYDAGRRTLYIFGELTRRKAGNRETADALIEYGLTGTLQFADVSVDESTGMVTLRAIFPNPKQELLPGMYVRAILNEGVDDQAILLPQRALLRDAKGNPTTYVVNAENKVEIRPLKVGRTQGNSWVVLDGLKAGDKVIVEGLQKIRPGSPVRIAEPTPVKQGAPASEKR